MDEQRLETRVLRFLRWWSCAFNVFGLATAALATLILGFGAFALPAARWITIPALLLCLYVTIRSWQSFRSTLKMNAGESETSGAGLGTNERQSPP